MFIECLLCAQPGFLNLGTIDSLGQIDFVTGAVLCIIEYLATFLVLTH